LAQAGGAEADYQFDMRSDRLPRPSSAAGEAGLRRVAIAFLVAGGLAAIAGTLVPDPDTSDHTGLLILAAACLALASGLGAWRRPPAALVAWLPALGLALVAAAVAVAEPLASTPTYFLLPILASAYFGSARRLAIDVGLCAAGLALVLALWADPVVRTAVWTGTLIPVVGVALVVARLKRRLDAHVDGLRNLADTDPLTGVLNHGAFGAALECALDRYHATGCGATLLLLDIDHFKSVNDRFGHQEGDRMLQLVSGLLAQHRRRDDALGRVGGEEFALLLVDADADVAHRVAERIRAALRDATAHAPVPLTLSVGIAALSRNVASSHALLHAADRALYAAKDGGRDQAVTVEHAA
jgi:diguanylate cyclase (GGDEF)-like protein